MLYVHIEMVDVEKRDCNRMEVQMLKATVLRLLAARTHEFHCIEIVALLPAIYGGLRL